MEFGDLRGSLCGLNGNLSHGVPFGKESVVQV
jgi:hypothetical protein